MADQREAVSGPQAIARMDEPTVLYAFGDRAIYWLGVPDVNAFRCNCYLIKDGGTGLLVDPGGRGQFAAVRRRVAQVLPPERLAGMILCHQDPDVAASMMEWLEFNPGMRVFSTPRTQVLLPYYGCRGYGFQDVEAEPEYTFPSGATLSFIPAPFLHFPGAFVTYDTASRFLFSGDIWAALDLDWRLNVSSLEEHIPKMDLFHTEYMASNLAARGFVRRIEGLPIDAILPQHGSIIGAPFVPGALDYLRHLRCGLDIIYADLE